MAESEQKINDMLQNMSVLQISLKQFTTLIQKASKILQSFSKSLASIVKKPSRFGCEIDSISILLENNIITISEILSRFSRILHEESQHLRLSSQFFETTKKSIFDSFKFSDQVLQEAKKNFSRSEDIYCTKSKNNDKSIFCPMTFSTFTYCSPKKTEANDGLYKVFMVKQELYQQSEKIYNEKLTNIIETIKSTSQETVSKAQNAYKRIKRLYEKGIINFYEEEKKFISEENFYDRNTTATEVFQPKFSTPVKEVRRRSPNFSNFDSEVRIEESDQKKNEISKNLKEKEKTVNCITFKEQKEEDHKEGSFQNPLLDSKKSSEYGLNCRIIESRDKLPDNTRKNLSQSQGLTMKKSQDFSLKGKNRYSDQDI